MLSRTRTTDIKKLFENVGAENDHVYGIVKSISDGSSLGEVVKWRYETDP